MSEGAKRILAYQQTPLVLTCEQSGIMPEDLLSTLTQEEQGYLFARQENPLEPLFFELMPAIKAAGVLPVISHLLMDVHRAQPRVFARIDDVSLPLLSEEGSAEFLVREYYHPFVQDVKRVMAKTEQRFGSAHIVHLSLLPRFIDKTAVDHDIVTFGEPLLSSASHEPEELRKLYQDSLVSRFPQHTWVGIHPNMFATHTLERELFDRLCELRARAAPITKSS